MYTYVFFSQLSLSIKREMAGTLFKISACITHFQVISGELLLKDLKREADEMRTLSSVQTSILSFFKMDNWDLAEQRFGSSVDSSKLLRFTVRHLLFRSDKYSVLIIGNNNLSSYTFVIYC